MKKLKNLLLTFALVIGIGAVALPAADAHAVNVFQACNGNQTAVCKGQSDSASGLITTVINTLLYVLGIIAVIMIVIGGIRYTTSSGDPSGVKSAKDTIIYSVVGLIVAILAYSIVNFVVGRF